jgi:hypothetical protein
MRLLNVVIIVTVTSGCSAIYTDRDSNRTNIAGAGSIFYEPKVFSLSDESDSFGTLDYCKLLKNYGFTDNESSSKTDCSIDHNKLLSADFGTIRDEVQDRVLASSNQKCGDYMRTLFAQKGDTEVFWGSLSTLFSGAGAVLSHMPTAQAFSAGGAVFSGINSEFQQAYFANKAIEVITTGINARRSEILKNIILRREQHNIYLMQRTNLLVDKTLKTETEEIELKNKETQKKKPESKVALSYSLNASIRDALQYHSACSTVVGLEVAAESIARVQNPGIAEVSSFMKKLKEAELVPK